jgi:sugar O-acyltransferase (sialic acid O-acetyltransferase NeuD family)
MHSEIELDFSRLYVFGAGGHGRETAWLAENAWRDVPEIVFLVDDQRYASRPVDGHPVRLLGDEEFGPDSRFVVAVGDPAARRRVAGVFESRGASAATIVHPGVERSARVAIGAGAVVFPGSVLTTNVTIGRHAHLNAACTVSHDSRVGDFSSLSPGVHVAGNVHIGEGVFVGVGASIINGSADAPLVIGDDAVIAAGACVIRSVDPGSLVAGVPAVRKR